MRHTLVRITHVVCIAAAAAAALTHADPLWPALTAVWCVSSLIAHEIGQHAVYMRKGDAAIIAHEWGQHAFMARMPDNAKTGDNVPGHVVVLAAIAARIANDDAWVNSTVNWFVEYKKHNAHESEDQG